ncbi:hypothetical protein A7U60_g5504 [Sanghuangporus baumii]|uniref:Uncharacterized protein n=1 Tax=Sanghuangporus baumii TaxID=108892 RepID=A0A9Q5NBD7_SANBA|nr:hypothetical protein A7U60_g5504 [Sanghuangporus baumii]
MPAIATQRIPDSSQLESCTVTTIHRPYQECNLQPALKYGRLTTKERCAVRSGNVYIWEQRGRNPETTGVSQYRIRVRAMDGWDPMECILPAYFIPATVGQLRSIDDIPALANIRPPEGKYTNAKMGKGRARGEYYPSDIHGGISAAASSSMSGQQYPPSPIYVPHPGLRLLSPLPRENSSPQGLHTPSRHGSSSSSPPSTGFDRQMQPNAARLLPPPSPGLRPALPL